MMQKVTMQTHAQVSAVLAFLLCLIGGLWILLHVKTKDDTVWVGISLSFVGKAFFVGPMLLVAAGQLGRRQELR